VSDPAHWTVVSKEKPAMPTDRGWCTHGRRNVYAIHSEVEVPKTDLLAANQCNGLFRPELDDQSDIPGNRGEGEKTAAAHEAAKEASELVGNAVAAAIEDSM
jgi:hypothetical protein